MRRIALLTVLVSLVAAAPASAQAVSTATPNLVGQPARLHFDVDALAPPVSGRVPTALAIAAPAGFRFDPRAVAERCTRLEATLNECPRASRFGSGVLVIGVTMPDMSRDVAIRVVFYLSSDTRVYAVAFVTGWRVVPGVIDRSNGLVLRFDPLPSLPAVVPQVTFTMKRLVVDLWASRLAKKSHKRKAGASRKRVYLIRTPGQCPGSWASSVTLTFPDGTTAPLAAPTPCASG